MRIVMQSSWLMDASSHREMGEGQQVRAGQRLFWVGKLAHAIAGFGFSHKCAGLDADQRNGTKIALLTLGSALSA